MKTPQRDGDVMTGFTVYLFVRAAQTLHGGPGDAATSTERRLNALHVLRNELVALGIQVAPVPDLADLQVEITNVFATREATTDHRVVMVRLSIGSERLEFVCSDGVGRVPAERQAAKRIVAWLDSPGVAGALRLPQALTAGLSTHSDV
jgi:hypothetical protein